MRMDKLTNPLQSALADAQSLAVGRENQFIEPTHLMAVLLDQQHTVAQVEGRHRRVPQVPNRRRNRREPSCHLQVLAIRPWQMLRAALARGSIRSKSNGSIRCLRRRCRRTRRFGSARYDSQTR